MLYELVLFIQCHVANIMMEFAVPASVASLPASVAGKCGRALCLGAVHIPEVDWGYGLVGACIDAGDEVDEVARQGNENGVCAVIAWAYRGIIDCAVGHWEA
jgi:hypothetical protein